MSSLVAPETTAYNCVQHMITAIPKDFVGNTEKALSQKFVAF